MLKPWLSLGEQEQELQTHLHEFDIHQFSKHLGKYNASIPNKNIETYNQKSINNTLFRASRGERT
ncbi:hypothetical protein YC2023_107455 [Brassica napus]